jgi:hypothetical protein
MPAHVRLLAGSTGSTASLLLPGPDCLAAALQILVRRHTPPRGLQMSRRTPRADTCFAAIYRIEDYSAEYGSILFAQIVGVPYCTLDF